MKKNTDNEQLVKITEEISVFYEIDKDHYFLIRTSQLAKGFCITTDALTKRYNRNKEKFKRDKDFVIQNNVMKWTRQGIITLSWLFKNNSNIGIFQNWTTKGFKKPIIVHEYIKLSDTDIIERDKLESITITREQLYNLLLEVQEITNPKVRKSILTKLLSYDTANKNQ